MKLRSKLIAGLAALGVLGGIATIAHSQAYGTQIITSLVGTEYISNLNATLSQAFSTKTLAGYARSTGLLYTTSTTSAAAATTSENTLGTYSVAAGVLGVGDMLRIKASFSATADAAPKTVKCYFGSEAISSGSLTTNNKNGSCEVIVTGIGAATQIVYGNMLVDTTAITGYVSTTATETASTTTVPVKVTSTSASGVAGTITLNSLSVELLGP